MVMAARAHLYATCTCNGAPAPEAKNPSPPPPPPPPSPLLLSASKPSWVVKSESNVRREMVRKPDPPCVVCRGSGRVDCHHCNGKGRTNHSESAMLPRGEWPKWCRSCGGSGLEHCSRCLGTGEYRYIMGFQFMERESEEERNRQATFRVRNGRNQRSFTDLLLNADRPDSDIGSNNT